MTELDPDGPVPVYQQLAAVLRGQIERGEIGVHRAIPSKVELRRRYGVGAQTVERAVQVLREAGMLVPVQGKGLYVRPREEWGKG